MVWSTSALIASLSQRKSIAESSETEQRAGARTGLAVASGVCRDPSGNLEFLAADQSYYFEGVSAEFSEERLGEFRAAGAELRAGPFNESLGSLEGVTAWKEGTVYLASVDLWEGVKLDSFVAQLARPGGVALGSPDRAFRRLPSVRCFLRLRRRHDDRRFRGFGFARGGGSACRTLWFSWQGRGSNS